MTEQHALRFFVQYQNSTYKERCQSEFCEEVKQSSISRPFRWIGCHYAGKGQLAHLACQNMVFCHINQNERAIWEQETFEDFVKHLSAIVFLAESRAGYEVARPAPYEERTVSGFESYLNVILSERSIIFVFSFRDLQKEVYRRIDTWLRQFLNRLDHNKTHAHIIYTAWPSFNPFGMTAIPSRHKGEVTHKPLATSGTNSISQKDINAIHIPCPLAPDMAYKIFCEATDSEFPELTQEVLADWYGGHLGAILFLAKALKEHWTSSDEELSLVERIKECVRIRSEYPDGVFSRNLRLSVGYNPKTRKIPDGIPTEKYGLYTSNGRYIRLLEYATEPIDTEKYFYNFRKFTVRLLLNETSVTGIVIKQQGQWYVLTCSHCVKPEEIDTKVVAFNNSSDRAFVVRRTGEDNSINDMALLALKSGPVVNYLTSFGISPPELQDLKLSENTSCYSFGYGTNKPNNQPRHTSWGQDTIGEFQAVNMSVEAGDSGSPVWYWDDFDFFIAGMVVQAGVENEAGVIQADKLYRFVKNALQDSERMNIVDQWRNGQDGTIY